MARRRTARGKRRVAERTRANALRLEAAIAAEEERPRKLKSARHVEQLAFLEGRGAITERQRSAGERLRRDFMAAGGQPRLIMSYEPRMARPPRQHFYNGDDYDPVTIDARRRFEKAIRPLGPRLVPVVMHTAVLDLPISEWASPGGAERRRRGPAPTRARHPRRWLSDAGTQGRGGLKGERGRCRRYSPQGARGARGFLTRTIGAPASADARSSLARISFFAAAFVALRPCAASSSASAG
jgi:Domain of unknown function (DUF6456)